MILVDVEQGTPEWWEARLGIPTASEFDKILTPANLKPSTSAETYLNKLVGEWVRGRPDETFKSEWMKRGNIIEPEARDFYAFQYDLEPIQVGFCKTDDGRYGCSPDSLVGDEGGVEIKSLSPGEMVKFIIEQRVPLKHKLQVIGCMLVTGREWWDFLAYHPDIRPPKIRVYRREVLKEITALQMELNKFCEKLLKTRELVKERIAA
jgi:hypothetical protein